MANAGSGTSRLAFRVRFDRQSHAYLVMLDGLAPGASSVSQSAQALER